MIYKPAPAGRRRAADGDSQVLREAAVLTVDGKRHELDASARVVIGRSKDCDIRLADPNVSRRHAEVRQEGATYWVVDLDSTNGIEVQRASA